MTESLRALANHLPQSIKIHMVYGGVSINPQMQALRGGTPAEINTQHRTLLDRWEAEIETAHARSRGELRRLTNREVWTMVGE